MMTSAAVATNCSSSLWNIPNNLLLRRQTRTKNSDHGWGAWKSDALPILTRDSAVATSPIGTTTIMFSYHFELGGCLKIALDILSPESQAMINDQIMGHSEWFREYPIQGVTEPRVHFILHKNATEDFASQQQPGYKYRLAAMKSRPLSKMPAIEELADRLEQVVVQSIGRNTTIVDNNNVETTSTTKKVNHNAFWNLGVDVVMYRNGHDSIGQHKDQAQGESVIFTVLAQCQYPRRICIVQADDPSVRFELFLRGGDGYWMDGEMQEHYTHGVPPVNKQHYKDLCRIALVFRKGDFRMLERDTGTVVKSLMARRGQPIPRPFGQINGLLEGQCYMMNYIHTELHAHGVLQAGVSGNKREGCDSIVVAGKQQSDTDCLVQFEYTAEQKHGGYALDLSVQQNKPIRVLRSSNGPPHSLFRPPKSLVHQQLHSTGTMDCTRPNSLKWKLGSNWLEQKR
jgi:2OG-Fe(II) oxygenase superfamily/SAD/SRA domain